MIDHLSSAVQSQVLKSTGNGARRIDRTTIQLRNGKFIIFRTSKVFQRTGLEEYFFGLPKAKFESYPREQLFVVFACGSTNQILVISGTYLQNLLSDVEPSDDGAWKIHIYKRGSKFDFSVPGKPTEDVSDFHNAFAHITQPSNLPTEGELAKQIQKSRVTQQASVYSVGVLVDRFNKGELSIPSFQRGLVWTIEQQSQFIESLFINIPMPSITLHKRNDEGGVVGPLEVIDGGQRLRTLARFKEGELSLIGSERLPGLAGMTFPMLPAELQLDFLSHSLPVIQFGGELDPDLLVEAFTRYNRGSEPLRAEDLADRRRKRKVERQREGETVSELVAASQRLFPESVVLGTRRYIEQVAIEANIAYEKGLYDACAVMIRRLLETLIIECYEKKAIQSKIMENDDYISFDKLIDRLLAETTFHFERGPKQSLRRLKEVRKIGDFGAHGRQVLITQHDIDQFKQEVRIAVEALITVSELKVDSTTRKNRNEQRKTP